MLSLEVMRYAIVAIFLAYFSDLSAQEELLVHRLNQELASGVCSDLQFEVSSYYQNSKSKIQYLYAYPFIQGIRIANHQVQLVADEKGQLIHSHLLTCDWDDSQSEHLRGMEESLWQYIQSKEYDVDLSAYSAQLSQAKWEVENPSEILEEMQAEKVYYLTSTEVRDSDGSSSLQFSLRAAYEIHIRESSGNHWWNAIVSASDDEILQDQDLVLHCEFHHVKAPNHDCGHDHSENLQATIPNSYRVLPLYVESPSHGDFTLEVDPADLDVSPLGWHDDGTTSYTDTRGNNVDAYEDRDANNAPGYRPDGGADLEFDFSFDPNSPPINSEDAIITNLFYWNNLMHDVWYRYGFDEASGNFQEDNFGNGGIAGDYVRAEAQDGSGTNNANFSTPTDGGNPRMQMFLWTGVAQLEITNPSSSAGFYNYSAAGFGPSINSNISGNIILAYDANPDSSQACGAIVNSAEVNGNIALVDRGACFFETKVNNCEAAGAIAVIVCNNQPGAGTFGMGGVDTIPDPGIPSIMISYEDCQTIRMDLDNGLAGTIESESIAFDSDLDNGIICHEYGHGISIRLTGGAGTNSCLGSAEQMGEGWSDYFGLVMSQKPGHTHDLPRGIGTYVLGQDTLGSGIRPAEYCTDFAVNDFTYDDIDQVSQPHGVGFVWCTMIWDMTWALENHYGYEPDIFNDSSSAGNIVAYHLVMEGLRLQACNPGFVDGRDAILMADSILYNKEHECIIWNAFARRGLGFSADQGSANNRSDGAEAFDLPTGCDALSYEELFVIGPNPCDGDNLVIEDPITMDSTYRAKFLIESNATIGSGLDIIYQAGQSIELDTNFTVTTGALFEARIDPCQD